MSMTVKKGDNVVVIAGKEKGKTGKVVEVFPKDNRVLVDGLNIVTKHQKARKQDEKSAIVKKSAPIEASNVMVVCPVCGKATRVAHNEIDGKKVCPLNQQEIATLIDCGKVKTNQLMKELAEEGYIQMAHAKGRYIILDKGYDLLEKMSLSE